MTTPLVLILAIASIAALVFIVVLSAGLSPTISGFLIRMAIFRSLFGDRSQKNTGERGTIPSVLILVAAFALVFSVSVVFSSTVALLCLLSVIAIVGSGESLDDGGIDR